MASNESSSTVGVFDDLQQAERTVDELRRAGFSQEEIGIIGNVEGGGEPSAPPTMKAPEENVTTGMTTGGALGAVVGLLVIVVLPGLGEATGFGRWFEILGGVILGAAVGGSLFAFSTLFLTPGSGRYLSNALEKGHYVVTVRNPQRQTEAVNVLRRQGTHVESRRD